MGMNIFQELDSLNYKIKVATEDLMKAHFDYERLKNKAWLETDFKTEGCTNDKQRTAYVNNITEDLKEKLRSKEAELEFLKREYEILKLKVEDLE